MELPINVNNLLKVRGVFADEAALPVRVAIFVDPTASADLTNAVRESFVPATSAGKLHVELFSADDVPRVESSSDLVLVLAGKQAGAASVVADATAQGIEAIVLTIPEHSHEEHLAALEGIDPSRIIIGIDSADAIKRLSGQIASGTQKRLALATNFVFLRKAVAKEVVSSTAFQNTLIGVLVFIPGADLPTMTLNQAKMALQLASAYGRPLSKERIPEIVAVALSAFGFRGVARLIASVLPSNLSWLVKGAMGYLGTIAVGAVGIAYFEKNLNLYTSLERFVKDKISFFKKDEKDSDGNAFPLVRPHIPSVKSVTRPGIAPTAPAGTDVGSASDG